VVGDGQDRVCNGHRCSFLSATAGQASKPG
jgi:hypothetical protein